MRCSLSPLLGFALLLSTSSVWAEGRGPTGDVTLPRDLVPNRQPSLPVEVPRIPEIPRPGPTPSPNPQPDPRWQNLPTPRRVNTPGC